MNIEASALEDVFRMEAMAPKEARTQCAHWLLENVSLSIHGAKITRNTTRKLQSQLHDGHFRDYLLEREEWAEHTFNNISWASCGIAFHRLSRNRFMATSNA
jgi:hypothetical protein